jgi:hypothetical protein
MAEFKEELGTLQKRLTVVSGMEQSGFPETNIQL